MLLSFLGSSADAEGAALLAAIDAAASWADEPSTLVADLIEEVLELNGGAVLDDIAALLLTGGRGAA